MIYFPSNVHQKWFALSINFLSLIRLSCAYCSESSINVYKIFILKKCRLFIIKNELYSKIKCQIFKNKTNEKYKIRIKYKWWYSDAILKDMQKKAITMKSNVLYNIVYLIWLCFVLLILILIYLCIYNFFYIFLIIYKLFLNFWVFGHFWWIFWFRTILPHAKKYICVYIYLFLITK